MLGESKLPLFKSVQQLMSFDSPQNIKVKGVEMDLTDYLASSLKVYAEIPNEKLKHNLAHLKKAKVAMASKFIDVV
jgi:hypothetical protein